VRRATEVARAARLQRAPQQLDERRDTTGSGPASACRPIRSAFRCFSRLRSGRGTGSPRARSPAPSSFWGRRSGRRLGAPAAGDAGSGSLSFARLGTHALPDYLPSFPFSSHVGSASVSKRSARARCARGGLVGVCAVWRTVEPRCGGAPTLELELDSGIGADS
jgi:hypothetical protein